MPSNLVFKYVSIYLFHNEFGETPRRREPTENLLGRLTALTPVHFPHAVRRKIDGLTGIPLLAIECAVLFTFVRGIDKTITIE